MLPCFHPARTHPHNPKDGKRRSPCADLDVVGHYGDEINEVLVLEEITGHLVYCRQWGRVLGEGGGRERGVGGRGE